MRRLVFLAFALLSLPAWADAKAQAALEAILRQHPTDIVHAKALADGTVEIIFGIEASALEQARLIDALRAHADIRGVAASLTPRSFCRFD